MKYSDQYRVSCAQIFNELSQAKGATADERVREVLSKYGWDKELARIKDDAFRAVVVEMLQGKALRKPMKAGESGKSARDIELDRWRAETDKIAASGLFGDLVADGLVGLETLELAGRLPRETYFIPSLGEYVSRADLPSKLDALAELRKQTQLEYRKLEDRADVLRAELFIFDELIRRGMGDRSGAEISPTATGPH
jgi:hypothetical protein